MKIEFFVEFERKMVAKLALRTILTYRELPSTGGIMI